MPLPSPTKGTRDLQNRNGRESPTRMRKKGGSWVSWVGISAEGSFGRQRLSAPSLEMEHAEERADIELGWGC